MSLIVPLLIRALGFFGVKLSPFWVGAVVAGIIAAAAAGAGLYLFNAGWSARDATCDAEQLRTELAQARATLAEKDRQLAAVNAIQIRDAIRAANAEIQLQANQKAIDETPPSTNNCLPRAAVGRVRNVR